MLAIVTDTGGVKLLPQNDADRFILKRLMDYDQTLYRESACYLSDATLRCVLSEVTINVAPKPSHA